MWIKNKTRAIFSIVALVFLCGCATTASKTSGNLDKSAYRNVVILGEHYSKDVAPQYANKYDARVLYSMSTQNFASNAISNAVRGVIGPSRAMRDLILELKSINHTTGEWLLMIPPSTERYFLVTLRNMEDGALKDADASIFLIKGVKNDTIESEIIRVSGGRFKVRYGEPF